MAKGQTSYGTNAANNAINSANGTIPGVIAGTQASQGQANQNQQGSFNGGQAALGTAGGIVQTAGTNAESAVPTYSSMAETGGFTPDQQTTYLNRATQGVAGTYDVLGQAAKNREAATGGLGTGGDISQMARQGTQAQASATENAQADLNQQINANKLAGAQGLVNTAATEGGLAGQENTSAAVDAGYYNTSTNQLTTQGQQILNALGIQYGTDENGAQILGQLSKDPTTFQQWLSAIGGAAGTAAGIAGGIPTGGGGGGGGVAGASVGGG
jgi:hypothetical protein